MSAHALPLGAPTQTISRRALLQAGGTLAGALAFGGAAGLLTGPGASGPSDLRRSDYAPYLGAIFTLAPPDRRGVAARLEAIENIGGAPAGSDHAFSLVFRIAARDVPLEQAVMRVRHPSGVSQALLVAPISRRGRDFAAVINRSRPH